MSDDATATAEFADDGADTDASSNHRGDALRAQLLTEPGFYSPALHIATTSVLGVGLMIAAAMQLHAVTWWQLGFGLVLWVLANATEWRIHKTLLHHRTPPLHILYDRHTPMHHLIYRTASMEIRDRRELRLVLLPAFAIAALFLSLLPAAAMIWYGWPFRAFAEIDQHNLAAIFLLVTVGFVVSYEWLHLSYHLPESSFIGRLGVIKVLRRHHAQHHDPALMQRWNFNVTVPLWDLVRGTYWRK